jgi:MurNAc alpha-1-phosphate uridylyltransferase
MKVMILAAGLGTRLQLLTQDRPKALVEINGITLLEHLIRRLKSFGFRDIIINVHHFPDQIIKFLKSKKNFGIDIKISDERQKLLDTGGGLKKAAGLLQSREPILVHNVDVLSHIPLQSLIIEHLTSGSLATLAVSQRESSRCLIFNQDNQLIGWQNTITGEIKGETSGKKATKKLAFSGIQVISPKIFKLLPDKEVFSLIDLYLNLCPHYKIQAHEHEAGQFLDVGQPEQLAKAEKFLFQPEHRITNQHQV